MKLTAKTLHGLEPLLIQELQAFGAKNVKAITRGATFEGDHELLYRCNYASGFALRILRPIYRFQARSERQLYHKIKSYNWAMHFGTGHSFAISSHVHSHHFRHSQYVALKTKDAIVDQFRKKTGDRPNIDTEQPDFLLNIHVSDDNFTVSLDSSGASLHRRGYRDSGHPAPLNEVLAAGMLALAGWTGDQTLLDPMCGTGTLLLEAAMMASQTPPGFHRQGDYAFERWKDYEEETFERVKEEAKAAIQPLPKGILHGGDIDRKAVAICRNTFEQLGWAEALHLERCRFADYPVPTPPGLLITNPPYGERMDVRDIQAFYEKMGDILKKQYPGWTAWIISSNRDALKRVGLRTSQKKILFNGPLECRYQQYELYAGKAKSNMD